MKRAQQGRGAVVGVAWYRAEEWRRLKEVVADPDVLENTHAEWLAIAEKHVGELRAEGVIAEPVEIVLDELLDWCDRKCRPLDSAARAAFTVEKLRATHRNEGE